MSCTKGLGSLLLLLWSTCMLSVTYILKQRVAKSLQLGSNAQYVCHGCHLGRKSKEREAIFAADDGAAPPLSQRGPALPWGHLGGSEALMPPGLRQVRLPFTSATSAVLESVRNRWSLLLFLGTNLGGIAVIYAPRRLAFEATCCPGRRASCVIQCCTTAPDPPPGVQWKSCAVIAMLERRVGDDQFRKLLQRLVTAAARQPTSGAWPAHAFGMASTHPLTPSLQLIGDD